MADGVTAEIHVTGNSTRSTAFHPTARPVQQYKVMRPQFAFHPHGFALRSPSAKTGVPTLSTQRNLYPCGTPPSTSHKSARGPLGSSQRHQCKGTQSARVPYAPPQTPQIPRAQKYQYNVQQVPRPLYVPNKHTSTKGQHTYPAQTPMRMTSAIQYSTPHSVTPFTPLVTKFGAPRLAQSAVPEKIKKNPEFRHDILTNDVATTAHTPPKKAKADKLPPNFKCAVALVDGQIVVRGPGGDLDTLKKGLKKLTCFDGATFIEDKRNSGRVVALDFDRTIVQTFLWAELGGLDGADTQLRTLYQWARTGKLRAAFGTQERIDTLRAVLEVCQERGDVVCVLSSGYAKVIRPALQFIGLGAVFSEKNVYGSDTWPGGISKSHRLTHIKEYHGRPRATLVDDDIGYCRGCLRDGHDVIWVKCGRGMQQLEMEKLLLGKWDKRDYLKF